MLILLIRTFFQIDTEYPLYNYLMNLAQRSPAWHAARKGKLTASNVGAALGLCSWTTRKQAYERALGIEHFVGNDATRWGTTNEPNGILAYSAHTGNVVAATGLHIHPHHDWLAASPDGLVGTEGMVEVKCPYWRKKDGTRLHKAIPQHYYLQMNLCLECTNRKWCDFITWAPEGYKIFRVYKDQSLHDALMPHYLTFFAAMQRDATSPPLLSKEDRENISAAIAASMDANVNYTFWENASLDEPPPSPESEDYEEEPKTKRVKILEYE